MMKMTLAMMKMKKTHRSQLNLTMKMRKWTMRKNVMKMKMIALVITEKNAVMMLSANNPIVSRTLTLKMELFKIHKLALNIQNSKWKSRKKKRKVKMMKMKFLRTPTLTSHKIKI